MIQKDGQEVCGEKGEDISAEMFDTVTHEVSTAAMKYALLSVSCMTQINFDIARLPMEDASPFILYNSLVSTP